MAFQSPEFSEGLTLFKILQIQYQQLAAERRQHHLSLKTGSAPTDKKMLVEHSEKQKGVSTKKDDMPKIKKNTNSIKIRLMLNLSYYLIS